MFEKSAISKSQRPTFVKIYTALNSLLSSQWKDPQREADIPDGFICPITQDVMKDPTTSVSHAAALHGNRYHGRLVLMPKLCFDNISYSTHNYIPKAAKSFTQQCWSGHPLF